jgi:anhydro-N-acetylmuramic acid kinase
MMSGTSLDGVDLVYCRFSEAESVYSFELLEAGQVPFEPVWKDRLELLPRQSAEVYAKTHVYFGHVLGRIAADFISRHKLKPDFVAAHGQTIFHQPDKNFTAQIGDGETMVSYLPCPLVCNFRNKDVALGGQGAPLVPFGEKHLFAAHRFFLNLGGFSNLTAGDLAFDVSPCNIVLNLLARQHDPALAYDPDGAIARSGKVHSGLLAELDALPYYQQPPPKSLGWEWVEQQFLPVLSAAQLPVPDLLRSCTEHIARQIQNAVHRFQPDHEKILISGGGWHNRFLMEQISASLEGSGAFPDPDTDKWIVDFKEAIIFAFLGLQTLTGRVNTLTSVTGARQSVAGGSIHLPPSGGMSLLS